ncbi:hypothetical protein [Desulfonatronum lacustre]|uniref:hypothetical protein n=1 Tax=Desulfonatronum lacustre TaxID=66849 RepID=UPI0004AD6240|nr:hypothetical protein [Desulfonatronum lacustre]
MEKNRCNRDVSCKSNPPVAGLNRQHSPKNGFDPELMFVECHRCGRPLVWNQGEASQIIEQSGIDTKKLDAQCLILAEGCPQCAPGEGGYMVRVVRLREDGYRDVKEQGH